VPTAETAAPAPEATPEVTTLEAEPVQVSPGAEVTATEQVGTSPTETSSPTPAPELPPPEQIAELPYAELRRLAAVTPGVSPVGSKPTLVERLTEVATGEQAAVTPEQTAPAPPEVPPAEAPAQPTDTGGTP
jgi:hypothetical protein